MRRISPFRTSGVSGILSTYSNLSIALRGSSYASIANNSPTQNRPSGPSHKTFRPESVLSPQDSEPKPVAPKWLEKFTEEEKEELSSLQKSNWVICDGTQIEKVFLFRNFKQCWDFTQTIINHAIVKKHHPEFATSCNTSFSCTFIRWKTLKAGRLSVKDIRNARHCEETSATWKLSNLASNGSPDEGLLNLRKGLLRYINYAADGQLIKVRRNKIGLADKQEARKDTSHSDISGVQTERGYRLAAEPSIKHKERLDLAQEVALLSKEQDQDEEQYQGGLQDAEKYILRVVEVKGDFLRENLSEKYERYIQRVLNDKRLSLRHQLGLGNENKKDASTGNLSHEEPDERDMFTEASKNPEPKTMVESPSAMCEESKVRPNEGDQPLKIKKPEVDTSSTAKDVRTEIDADERKHMSNMDQLKKALEAAMTVKSNTSLHPGQRNP
ncbi:MAG: hypothetical protein M1812_002499 [Candelaria pacifica]|nr:MAG: hypothetical protein M1812_002499 [Candelaria pacifica]